MAKSSFHRRDFLKISALGASSLAWSGCASLESLFMGDASDLRNEVVILGAGAAGLAAALELKKRKVQFRVFEASSRIGGRAQSVPLLSQGGNIAELGAEFVDVNHVQVRSLAKEFNLPLYEIKSEAGLESHLFSFGRRKYSVKELLPRLKTLQKPLNRVRKDLFRNQDVLLSSQNALQFERSSYYDSLTLQDLLSSWGREVDPVILKLIGIQATQRFGVDPSAQSALHFLSTLESEGSSLLMSGTTYRMQGGLSSLMQNMASRVAGVIPDHIVKLNRALIAMKYQDGEFDLTFAGPRGKEHVRARKVICTIPFSKLREVQGIADLGISPMKKEIILNQQYGTHSKGVLVFPKPFWRTQVGNTPANLGNFTGDFLSQKVWDSSRSQEGTLGVLSWQRAGLSGAQAQSSASEECLKDLGLFYANMPEPQGEVSQFVNWSQRKWSKGSMAVYRPGQYMKYHGLAAEPEFGGQLLFAGEHVSLAFAGTLEGAIQTGQRAADEIAG